MPKQSQPPPIFIIGAPRSGTTLLAAMLNAHSRLCCGNETHFFEGMGGAVSAYVSARRYWPNRACLYASKLRHLGRSLFELYNVDFDEYCGSLARARPSVPAILHHLMAAFMVRANKQRWVEKTPNHLKRFARLRLHFPSSPTICLIRDPRDVALSLMNVPWGVSSFTDGLLVWRSYFQYYKIVLHDKYSLTIKFEDLIERPEHTLKSVCSFIGEPYEANMLDTSHSAVDVGSSVEPYKQNASNPTDPARVYVWRRELHGPERSLAHALLGPDLTLFDYPVQKDAVEFAQRSHGIMRLLGCGHAEEKKAER